MHISDVVGIIIMLYIIFFTHHNRIELIKIVSLFLVFVFFLERGKVLEKNEKLQSNPDISETFTAKGCHILHSKIRIHCLEVKKYNVELFSKYSTALLLPYERKILFP